MAKQKKISGYTGSATEVTLPTSVAGTLVGGVGANVFADKGITKITTNIYSDDPAAAGAPWGASDATIVFRDKTITPTPPTPSTVTVTWDGDTTGKTIVGSLDEAHMVLVSSNTPSLNQLKNGKVIMYFDVSGQEPGDLVIDPLEADDFVDITTAVRYADGFMVVYSETTAWEGKFTIPGIYFVHQDVDNNVAYLRLLEYSTT